MGAAATGPRAAGQPCLAPYKSIFQATKYCLPVQAWLLPAWKQEATLALATCVCRLLAAASAAPEGNLLRYVPEMYLEATLDMVSHGMSHGGWG